MDEDLAAAMALVSAHLDRVVPNDLIAFGEVGLAGEVRPVTHLAARLREAERIGFTRAVVPAGSEGLDTATGSIAITAVRNVAEAMRSLAEPSDPAPF